MTAKIAVTASIVCAPRRLSAWGGEYLLQIYEYIKYGTSP